MKPIIYAALVCGAMMCVSCGRSNAPLAAYPKQTITYDLPDPEESKWTQFFSSIRAPKIVQPKLDVVEVNPRAEDIIMLADLVAESEIVELELTDQSILKRISSVFYHDDRYIIADKGTKAIYIFSREGKFLSKINRRGRAANEYLNMSRVMFDAKNEWIIICDMTEQKLLYYTLAGDCVAVHHLAERCDHRFQDIINLPNGNFLCYEFMHGTPTPAGFDGIWEMTPEGDLVRWLYRNELIHPTSSPLYAMAYNPQGEISVMCMEEDADFEYDEELRHIVKYVVRGVTASYFSGMNNSDYASHWGRGEMFNSRQWATTMGRYILSKWSGDKRNVTYYSLYDTSRNSVAVGVRIEYCTTGKARCLPSVVIGGKESLEIVPSNLQGCVAVPLYMETLLSDKYASAATELLGNRAPEDMNPLLQIWKVK